MSDAPNELHVLAGEYVLGVLDADEQRAVRRQSFSSPPLAAAIAAWEARLAPLARLIRPVTPPPALWSRIEAGIDAPAVGAIPLRTAPPPSSEAVALPAVSQRRPNVRFWRGATLVMTASAAVLAMIAYLPKPQRPGEIAALAPLSGPPVPFVAEARPDGQLLVTAVAPAGIQSDRDLQLWILPQGAQAPRSLGLLPSDPGKTVVIRDQPPPGAQLLVSVEPRGGSPSGQPTGAVLFGGRLAAH